MKYELKLPNTLSPYANKILDEVMPFAAAMEIIEPLEGEDEISHLMRCTRLAQGHDLLDDFLEHIAENPAVLIERAREVKAGKIPVFGKIPKIQR